MSLSNAAKKRRKVERAGNGKKPGKRVPKPNFGTTTQPRRKPRSGGRRLLASISG